MSFKKDIEHLSHTSAEVNIIPVLSGEMQARVNLADLPDELPILALRNAVIFPGTIYPVTIGREKSVKLISDAVKRNMFIGAVPQLEVEVEEPGESDLYRYGVVVKVVKTFDMPDGSISAVLQSFNRFSIDCVTENDPYIKARVHHEVDVEYDIRDKYVRSLAEMLKDRAGEIIRSANFAPKEAVAALSNIDDFSFLVNFIATTVEFDNFHERVALLGIEDMKKRAMELLAIMETQIGLLRIKQEINSKVKSEIDQQQREYYLNNQLRTIQEELGMDEDGDIDKLQDAASKKNWTASVREAFDKELAKLDRFNPSTPEYGIQYNYLQFMLELPWNDVSKDNYDPDNAQKILDKDHFGLEKVKERIVEHIAVLNLTNNMKAPILCLYGPPGVGKTSLGKSIAKALGRKYVRISLGGMHDEAELRGHRRTYVGAMPGRILSGIAKAGTSNPVVVLDEIDKLGKDFKGDPSSALLEVLDPEQNVAFHDNYLDIDYDLSKVMFITTANDISGIQPALLDRMELINVTGYIAEEKLEIAKKFLLPKQLKEHGITKDLLKVDKKALARIIAEYTHESGVRGLEKQIAKISRVAAAKIVRDMYSKPEIEPIHVKENNLKEYLGLPVSSHDKQKGNEGVGIVTGLAWTAVGGEILFVESSISDGKGALSMTGNLGDVMKESATIAYQYIKSHPEVAGITADEFAKKDVHIHVPEGATPKDGPSAGITIVTSMVSAFRGQAPKSGVAMTGEMTLRGKVLPVGGIKEKILAAKRSGVSTIIICEDNRKDIEDINELYIKGLDFVYVKTISDVLDYVFNEK